ncbi:hypothetical protein FC756_15980 [Lysinibacillus mangiferihumi]|uniref:Uncharacterized protein n=1 Tax=Lysinibacillus mangiferihumi TaxID=1130819 RepID=A0A4U2YVG4_9BACI|nr:hypothetical protein [Lysinibacillus mangiferihumi]TKI65548.1 hypothetical protein FC756_15980 [Lysinibacillus mangiferihumi]
MFRYAQLNENNVVIAISDLTGEVTADNMILINDSDVKLGSTYDTDTEVFIPPTTPSIEPQPTVEEMQAQTLLNTEYLVSRSELGLGGN